MTPQSIGEVFLAVIGFVDERNRALFDVPVRGIR